MEQHRTDKQLLIKGLKRMGLSLILMFLGPTLFYLTTGNKEKPLYIPLLIVSICICMAAVFFAFKGIKIIMDSLFNKAS